MAELAFQLLGPVRAWRDGIERPVGSPQQQAVLAVLLLSRGRHVSLTAAIDALWGEHPPKASAGAVRTYVSRIRRALSDATADGGIELDATGEGYALRADRVTVDIKEFEALIAEANLAAEHDSERAAALCERALSLWQGTPLAGVPGPYAEPVRARMVELRADAVEIKASALIARGDHQGAIVALRRLVEDLPLREGVHELLMLALYRAGRRADALEVYADARRILREELGVEPGAALRRMHQRVLGADDIDAEAPFLASSAKGGPAVRIAIPAQAGPPAPAASPAHAHAASATSRLPVAVRDFVGHDELLAEVVDELSGRRAGRRVVVLEGMPGVGKTALAIRAGHQLAESYPDGQVLLELAVDGRPLRADEVMAALLQAVGGTGCVRVDTRAQPALGPAWRELTAGRRSLVVLDGVVSVEQVRAVLAAPTGCGFILTSGRTLLNIGDAVRHEVPPLDEAASLALLARLIGAARVEAEPVGARALLVQCCGLPSMIRAVGERLVSRPHWSLAAAAWFQPEVLRMGLREDGPGTTAMMATLRGLTGEQALVLRGAAGMGAPSVKVAEAAEAVGLPESTVREAFEHLADIHLLRPGEWATYRLDPGIRRLARLLDPD